jgi:hypothetical protein
MNETEKYERECSWCQQTDQIDLYGLVGWMFNASKLPGGSDPRAQWQQKDTKRPASAAYWDKQVKASEIWIDILSKRADAHSVFVIASGLHDVNFGVNADFDNGGHYEVALRRVLGRAKQVWPGLVVFRKRAVCNLLMLPRMVT